MCAADDAKQSMELAQGDFELINAAHRGITAEKMPWNLLCFHAQQAAEKYLRDFSLSRTLRFQKVHDNRYLLELCEQNDASLGALRTDCSRLFFYAGQSRYPGPYSEATENETNDAIAAAHRICDTIRSRIG